MIASIAELAAQLRLHRAGREWRGACRACGYPNAFVLAVGRYGRPMGWCANCRDRDAVRAIIGGDTAPAPKDEDETHKAAAATRDKARRLWDAARLAADTIAQTYLWSRGLLGLASSSALRFHPACTHPSDRALRLPALVAAVTDAQDRFLAVHRTYLLPDGSGKADIEPRKASLGPIWGGAIRLNPAAAHIIVGEGVEFECERWRLV